MTSSLKREKLKSPTITDKNGNKAIFTLQRAHQYWAERARNDICLFGEFVFGHIPAKHHRLWFETILDPLNDRILLVAPRESGKTMTLVALLEWWIGRNPHHTNAIASVSADQAEKRLMSVRDDIMYNERYKMVFPWVKPDEKKIAWTNSQINLVDTRLPYSAFSKMRVKAKNTMSLTAFGMGAKSMIGSRLTGLGIVDDPHDETAAYSETERQRAIDWYYRTFINCLLPGSKSIIITTRWHEEDLAGDLLEKQKNRYKIIEIPAIWKDEQNTEQSYWPEQWPLSRLKDKEIEITPRMFDALYMNNINALSGGVFHYEWLTHKLPYPLPKFIKVFISVDPAVTVKTSSDYTAIALCAIDENNNFYLLNMHRLKVDGKGLRSKVDLTFDQAVMDYGRCDIVLIEKYGTQTLIMQDFLNNTRLPVHGMNMPGDKVAKASSLEVLCSNGKFFADWDADWSSQLRSEMMSFPHGGRHDDMVDAVSQAAAYYYADRKIAGAKMRRIKNPYVV